MSLAQTFLTDSEQKEVTAAVQLAEKETSGEIVPMLVESSHHYPAAVITGSLLLSVPTALILAVPVGKLLSISPDSVWIFLMLFGFCFPFAQTFVKRYPGLKAKFLWASQVEEEVFEGAVTSFYSEKLHQTRDKNGILIYISVYEKKVWILADEGINKCIEQRIWDSLAMELSQNIKDGARCQALCNTIKQIGDILQSHFPIKDDDKNELHDLIIR